MVVDWNTIKLLFGFVKIVWKVKTFKKMKVDRIRKFTRECFFALKKIHDEYSAATLSASTLNVSDKLDFIGSLNDSLSLNILEACHQVNSLTKNTIKISAENQKLYLTQLIGALNIFCKKVYGVNALKRDLKEEVEKIEKDILHKKTYMAPYDFRPKILEEFKKTNDLTLSIKSTGLKDLLCFWRKSEIEEYAESARKG